MSTHQLPRTTLVLVRLQGLVSSPSSSCTSVKLSGTCGVSSVYAGYSLESVVSGSRRHRRSRATDRLFNEESDGQKLSIGLVSK